MGNGESGNPWFLLLRLGNIWELSIYFLSSYPFYSYHHHHYYYIFIMNLKHKSLYWCPINIFFWSSELLNQGLHFIVQPKKGEGKQWNFWSRMGHFCHPTLMIADLTLHSITVLDLIGLMRRWSVFDRKAHVLRRHLAAPRAKFTCTFNGIALDLLLGLAV